MALPKGMLVAWEHNGGRSVSRVATLGLGGLFISTSDPPIIGTLIKIVFDVPGGEVRARAIVKNVKAGKGMAVSFVEMGHADRETSCHRRITTHAASCTARLDTSTSTITRP